MNSSLVLIQLHVIHRHGSRLQLVKGADLQEGTPGKSLFEGTGRVRASHLKIGLPKGRRLRLI
jgi:hypothetical protein